MKYTREKALINTITMYKKVVDIYSNYKVKRTWWGKKIKVYPEYKNIENLKTSIMVSLFYGHRIINNCFLCAHVYQYSNNMKHLNCEVCPLYGEWGEDSGLFAIDTCLNIDSIYHKIDHYIKENDIPSIIYYSELLIGKLLIALEKNKILFKDFRNLEFKTTPTTIEELLSRKFE